MPVDLVLKNAKICLLDRIVEAGLAINDGRIVKVSKEVNLPPACENLNLKGNLVLPGVIDAHVHLRDQDLSYKEDFFTGTCAAASGGVTTVLDMPNNMPVTMSSESLLKRMEIAAKNSIVNVAFYSAFPKRLEEMREIVESGAKGFKFFFSRQIGGVSPEDEESLRIFFREAAKLSVPVLIHAEDKTFLDSKMEELKKNGRCNISAFSEAHSVESETKAIGRAVEMSHASGAHVHICHVSAGQSVNVVSSAKRRGIHVTCEVTPHHLLLSQYEMKHQGFIALTNPPLRSETDQEALWLALKSDVIDIISSDHAPHALHEKMKESVWDVSTGFPGLETMVPLMLTQVNNGRLSLLSMVRLMSKRPSEIFRIRGRGCLREGYYADLTVVNFKREWKIDSSKFYSKAKFSPFNGKIVKGKVIKTFVNGQLVMDEGEIIGKPGTGEIIR
ncbi:allantoinase AllB [Candidatus Bathyarchaeota archaeon]|nr:MAG: allantoinase AllB [Candidatus Bathyarchaeota archaeon]